jgi:hypothetical protein
MAVPPQSVVRVLWEGDHARGTRDRLYSKYLRRENLRLQLHGRWRVLLANEPKC